MLEPAAQAGRSNQERWADEASYFDAVDYPTAPIHPLIIERYARCCHKDYFWSEYFFSLLSDVKGKHILDIGCGAGTADERPLEEADLPVMRRYLTDFEMRFFAILGRLAASAVLSGRLGAT